MVSSFYSDVGIPLTNKQQPVNSDRVLISSTMKTRIVSFSLATLMGLAALFTGQGCASSSGSAPKPATAGKPPKKANALSVEAYIPITVVKAAPTTPSGARVKKPGRKATAFSIPVDTDTTFQFSPDQWPTGVASFSAKVRVFETTISDIAGVSTLTYNSAAPLAVFPGTSATYKSVSLNSANTPNGSVIVRIPSTGNGKNYLLIIAKDLAVGSDTWHYGGGSIFSTAP